MRRHVWKRWRWKSGVLWMEAKPRGSVGRQGRLIIALASLDFVLYINHVHRHAHVRTRVYYSALVVYRPRLWSGTMEDTIHFDRRRRHHHRRCGDANSGRRTCVTLTLVPLSAPLLSFSLSLSFSFPSPSLSRQWMCLCRLTQHHWQITARVTLTDHWVRYPTDKLNTSVMYTWNV